MIKASTKTALAVFAALITLGVIATRRAGESVADVGSAINPTNPENIFAEGVNALGDSLDNGVDDDSFSLGSWLFDVFNPNQPDITAPVPLPNQKAMNQEKAP